jgi:acetamidase/formamidase
MDVIEHTPEIYHLTFGVHEPVLKIKSGQRVHVGVPDCDGFGLDGIPLPEDKFEKSIHTSIPIANPTAGPYYIEGAEVGDAIVVNIHSVKPNRRLGRTGISAGQIHIAQKHFRTISDTDMNVSVPRKIFQWDIDVARNIATFKLEKSTRPKVEVPLSPFVGCIAVAPMNGQFFDGLALGNFGGNMDVSAVAADCRIFLPVFASGAYLFLGDIHAAQGDGEIIGGGIEISGTIEFSVTLKKGKTISWPRIENSSQIGVIASGTTMDEASQIANAQLVLWMAHEYGFDRWEALNVLSQTGQSRPGNSKSVCCTISKKYL